CGNRSIGRKCSPRNFCIAFDFDCSLLLASCNTPHADLMVRESDNRLGVAGKHNLRVRVRAVQCCDFPTRDIDKKESDVVGDGQPRFIRTESQSLCDGKEFKWNGPATLASCRVPEVDGILALCCNRL